MKAIYTTYLIIEQTEDQINITSTPKGVEKIKYLPNTDETFISLWNESLLETFRFVHDLCCDDPENSLIGILVNNISIYYYNFENGLMVENLAKGNTIIFEKE